MKLVFRGHDDRYAVEQSLLAFFPEERPVYQAPEPGEDNWARVDLHQSPVYATAITEIYTLSLHDALPILRSPSGRRSSGTGCRRRK